MASMPISQLHGLTGLWLMANAAGLGSCAWEGMMVES